MRCCRSADSRPMASCYDAEREVWWVALALPIWAVAVSCAVYACAGGRVLAVGWWGGLRASERSSSIFGSLRPGGVPPGWSKRCRQARPLTRRVDSADESDRDAWDGGGCAAVNAVLGRSRQRGVD